MDPAVALCIVSSYSIHSFILSLSLSLSLSLDQRLSVTSGSGSVKVKEDVDFVYHKQNFVNVKWEENSSKFSIF